MNDARDATQPIRRVLLAYDGSEPADAALAGAIGLARAGAALDILTVVDHTAALASGGDVLAFDPLALFAALDEQGVAVGEKAVRRVRSAGVEPAAAIVQGQPIPAIVRTAIDNRDDIIVLGTNARTGLSRTFLGSVTEGVLRASTTPVLAVRTVMERPAGSPIRKLLVAVDDSDPADAAAVFAGRLVRSLLATCTFVHVIDTAVVHKKANFYGYRPERYIASLRESGNETIAHARRCAALSPDESHAAVIEGKAVPAIVLEADRCAADAIVIGSHGRRGLQRLVLGSVAEQIVRQSPVPVFVVRCGPEARPAAGEPIVSALSLARAG
jgi:nucleotide-binding universal stress UspA family protein